MMNSQLLLLSIHLYKIAFFLNLQRIVHAGILGSWWKHEEIYVLHVPIGEPCAHTTFKDRFSTADLITIKVNIMTSIHNVYKGLTFN